MIDLDHGAVSAHRSGVDDAAGGGRANFGAVGLQQIDAGMQRRAAEERVGAVAERRSDAGSPISGLRTGTNGISAFRRSAGATSRATRASAWSNAGAFGSTSAGI